MGATGDNSASPVVLLTGGSGYVGGRLFPLLENQGVKLRCLARNPEKMRPALKGATEIVRGDVLDASSLDEALRGVHVAYYLVHLMSGSKDFEKEDRQAATRLMHNGRARRDRVGWPPHTNTGRTDGREP